MLGKLYFATKLHCIYFWRDMVEALLSQDGCPVYNISSPCDS